MTAIFICHSSADNAAAKQMVAWLESKGHSSLFLDFDPEAGIMCGGNWEQTLYQKVRQCQAVIALLTPSWLASKWCFAELAQARAGGKAIFPVKIRECEALGVFSDIQQIDLLTHPEEGYRRLEMGLKNAGLDPLDVFDWNPNRPPYPGLLAFQEDEAAIFFGRGEEIQKAQETLETLRRQGHNAARCVLLLGASGSGKSSLARAGIIPRLNKQSGAWLTVPPFRPQEDPIEELAVALSAAFARHGTPRPWDALHRALQQAASKDPADGRALLGLLRDLTLAAKQPEATVLLTLDQTEELFGYSPPEAATRFLRLLRSALETAGRRCITLATLRSDFLGEFQSHAQLQDRTGEYAHQFAYLLVPLDPMPLRSFSQIIAGPARLRGLHLEDGLAEAMVRDTATQDALPLLAFTLRRLYERHDGHGRLTLGAYEAIGGVEGAIRAEAERLLAEAKPSPQDMQALHAAFLPAMVRINAEGGYARRRARLLDMPPRAVPLLRRYVDARLLVTDRDQAGREVIEVAHEALLRTWPQLATWLTEDHDKLRLFEGVQRAAEEWERDGQRTDLLIHRDARLQDATTLLANPRFAVPDASIDRIYLDACAAAQSAREAAAKQAQEQRIRDAERIADEQRKAAAAQRKITQRTRIGMAVAVVLAIVAGVSGQQALDASHAARVSLHRSQLWEADLHISRGNTPQAVAQALRAGPDLPHQAVQSLSRAFSGNRLLAMAGVAAPNPDQPRLPGFNRDGSLLANFVPGHGPALLRLERGRFIVERDLHADGISLHRLIIGDDGQVFGIGEGGIWRLPAPPDAAPLYPCGSAPGAPIMLDSARRYLAIASTRDSQYGVCVVDLSLPGKVLFDRLLDEGEIRGLSFSPDSRSLLTASALGRAHVIDLADGDLRLSLPADGPLGRPFNNAVFDHTGERIAIAATDNRVRVYRSDGTPVAELAASKIGGRLFRIHRTAVRDVAFSSDGAFLVAVDDEGQVVLWSLDGAEQAMVLGNHALSISDVEIAPNSNATRSDQTLVLTASMDGTARLWGLETGKAVAVLGHDGSVNVASFSQDGTRLMTLSEPNGSARLWSIDPVSTLAYRLRHAGRVWSLDMVAAPPALAPDGGGLLLATAGFDGGVRLWRYARTSDGVAPELLAAFHDHEARVRRVSFSASGRLLASAGYDGTAQLHDLIEDRDCALEIATDSGGEQVYNALFAPPVGNQRAHRSGTNFGSAPDWLLITSDDRRQPVRLFSPQTCMPIDTGDGLRHGGVAVEAVAVGAVDDLTLVATGDAAGTVRLLTQHADGLWRKHCELDAGLGAIGDLALSADGTLIAAAGSANRAALIAVEAAYCGEPDYLDGHGGRVYSVDIAPGGEQILTASLDKTARVWRRDGKPQAVLTGHQDRVYHAEFSPDDGRWLLTASRDGSIRLWRSPQLDDDGSEQPTTFLPLLSALGGVADARFSPDGQAIAGAYWENAALLWRIWSETEAVPEKRLQRWGEDRAQLALIGEAYRFQTDNAVMDENGVE